MNETKSFWGTLPAIIVAIGGLLTVLYQTGIILGTEQKSGSEIPNQRQNISGTYLMDRQSNRMIVITNMDGNRYRIEEPTSPWPWTGTATLSNENLKGEASFIKSAKRMRIEGTVRNDQSISVSYIFLQDVNGRVDNHIWYLKR